MTKHLPYYILFILVTIQASCKEQDPTVQSQTTDQAETSAIQPIDKYIPIKEVDTLYAKHAPSRITRKIRKDTSGNLLIAAFEDVIRYDGNSFSILPKMNGIESFDAFDALQDSKGNLWIASTHFGVYCKNGNDYTHFTTENGLAHNRTMDLHEDKAGNIWIATMGGLSCYDGKSFVNYTTLEGLSHNDVNTILEDNSGKIWFGTRGTACIYDPKTSKFTEIKKNEGTPFTNVWSIIEDRAGNIWLGGNDGLWRYKEHSFTKFSNEFLNCVFEDHKGNIWTASSQGIVSLYKVESLKNKEVMPIEIFQSNSMLFRIMEDKMGYIWIGGLKGVYRYDGDGISVFMKKKE